MRLIASRHPPRLPLSAGLFLDFDGTLVPLAQRPQDVLVGSWLVPTLEAIGRGLDGALAIVSGRPLRGIDAFLHPLVLAAAGAHGVERRDANGRIELHRSAPPAHVVACAGQLAARHADLILELKPSGLALHFRLRPALGALCREALAAALAEAPGVALEWELLDGHCVCELKQRAVSKASAVRAYLAEPAFARRLPVFVGDDVTDEDGIQAVQAVGGFGIRVGPGQTQARYRLDDTHAVASWLIEAAADKTSLRNERHEA